MYVVLTLGSRFYGEWHYAGGVDSSVRRFFQVRPWPVKYPELCVWTVLVCRVENMYTYLHTCDLRKTLRNHPPLMTDADREPGMMGA